jgi:hypothetical protein
MIASISGIHYNLLHIIVSAEAERNWRTEFSKVTLYFRVQSSPKNRTHLKSPAVERFHGSTVVEWAQSYGDVTQRE